MNQSTTPICPKCHAPIPTGAPLGLCPKCVLLGAATSVEAARPSSHSAAQPTVAEIASHFPELEVLELIGVGGMGVVFKARQPKLDRLVALKILSRELAGDPAFTERFDREARVLARLNHPNIVTVFDCGMAGPFAYLMMEFVDGVNLRQAMRVGGFTPTESLSLVQDICTALKFAHETGILHRDIKPENVLIDSRGRVKIADFGIAKLVGKDERDDATLTMHGAVLGTPHYMAPEQIETPGEVDQRADIYSLGVVFYELLTRELPIGRFAPPSEKSPMDQRIDEIVMRALEKDRKARYQTAEEVRTSVGALAQSPSAPPQSRAARQTGERPAAKFNLTAVILTGLSLVLVALVAILVGVIHPGVATGPVEQRKFHLMFASIMLFIGLPAAISALTGFILGARALGEIRRSGGVKTGLGSAIFATVAWPILFLFFLASVPLQIRMPLPGDGPHLGPFAVIFVVLLPVFVAAWLLVRSLYRWAGGMERKDGTRFHPGLGIPLLMVMLVTIVGPLLLAVTARLILPAGERRDPQAEMRRFMEEEKNRHNASLAKADISASVDWHLGGPEVVLQLAVHPRYRAEFRLVQYEEVHPKTDADIGTWVPPSNPGLDKLDTCLVFIGTTIPREADLEGNRGVTVHLSGNKESGHLSTETDFAKWKWNYETLSNLPPLASAQRSSFEIASREESVDGKSRVTGKLILEVKLVERKP